MGNANFEPQICVFDEDDEIKLSLQDKGSRQSSKQCKKLVLEGYGKAPKFGKKIISTKEAMSKNNEGDVAGKSVDVGQSSTFSLDLDGSKQSRAQGNELVFEGKDKGPNFDMSKCLKKQAGNNNCDAGLNGKSSKAEESFSEIGGSSQREGVLRSSQDQEIPDFDSKDKLYWFTKYKRERALNKKLLKRSERETLKFLEVSKQMRVLYEIVNN